MARHAHEFECHCGMFNYPPLRDDMHGNYTVRCGSCGHEHYRVIVAGVITEDRHDQKYGAAVVINVLKSQCSKARRQLGVVAQIRQREAAGLAK